MRELGTLSIKEAIASSTVYVVTDTKFSHTHSLIYYNNTVLTSDVNAKMIVVLTETGNGVVAKFRPRQPILVLTTSNRAARISEDCIEVVDSSSPWRQIRCSGESSRICKKTKSRSERRCNSRYMEDIGHTNMMKKVRKKSFKRGAKKPESESGGVFAYIVDLVQI